MAIVIEKNIKEIGNLLKTFVIEKSIPIPRYRSNVSGYTGMYPFDKMVKGDSFFVPCSQDNLQRTQSNLWSAAAYFRKGYNKSFKGCCRATTGGVRYWCIEAEQATDYVHSSLHHLAD